ncbi:quinon protein alcohol dehydrogenase-like superfamily [Hygrophoropsis aurantiaca]|uniref:Quinon protein alcohol dehydrogenase-like superfamily n=1 Tax=Hygrophoropsis aurantiaca TaxID=72124 RepID=A0ACB7ZV35_9AGAM|nr:quinon protein alcohol dehydrogenase-like superfamily [Hygrophoropsis aurantiaca]
MASPASLKLGSDGVAPRLPTKAFEGHTDRVWSVAYFHYGKRLISGSSDKTVRIWDVESQKQEGESLVHEFGVLSMDLSPDERRLVSGGDGVVLWDLEGRTVMWKKEESEVDGFRVAYSPDGRLIAASHYKGIVLLNAETGEQIGDPLQFGEHAWCLAFSPDGTRLAAGSGNGKVRVFDVATGETIVSPIQAHKGPVTSMVYIQAVDGQQFITGSIDKSIRVFDAATRQEIDGLLGHEHWVNQIALSHNGQRLASSSADSTVRVWDLKTRQQIGGPLRTQSDCSFFSVAWSLDSHSILAGSRNGKIFLWDVPPFDDHTAILQAPAPTTSSLSNTSKSRVNSISSSILNIPAGSQLLNRTPATDRLPNDFFDSSPDLPSHAHNQISTIPIATVPLRSSIPHTTKPKSGPKFPSTAASSPSNVFGHIGSRFRRDKHAPESIEMQPPAHKVPKYSPVGKVALGQADKRLYMDESKDKKRQPGDSDSEQEVLADVEGTYVSIYASVDVYETAHAQRDAEFGSKMCCETRDPGRRPQLVPARAIAEIAPAVLALRWLPSPTLDVCERFRRREGQERTNLEIHLLTITKWGDGQRHVSSRSYGESSTALGEFFARSVGAWNIQFLWIRLILVVFLANGWVNGLVPDRAERGAFANRWHLSAMFGEHIEFREGVFVCTYGLGRYCGLLGCSPRNNMGADTDSLDRDQTRPNRSQPRPNPTPIVQSQAYPTRSPGQSVPTRGVCRRLLLGTPMVFFVLVRSGWLDMPVMDWGIGMVCAVDGYGNDEEWRTVSMRDENGVGLSPGMGGMTVGARLSSQSTILTFVALR